MKTVLKTNSFDYYFSFVIPQHSLLSAFLSMVLLTLTSHKYVALIVLIREVLRPSFGWYNFVICLSTSRIVTSTFKK